MESYRSVALSLSLVTVLGCTWAAARGSDAAPTAEDAVPEITPAFDANKSAYDPKHTPLITAPEKVKAGEWFEVTVEIGAGGRHPSLEEHFVRYIAIFNGEVEIARTYLHPVYSSPKVTFTIRLERTSVLRAMEEPNHTAGWIAEKKIVVSD